MNRPTYAAIIDRAMVKPIAAAPPRAVHLIEHSPAYSLGRPLIGQLLFFGVPVMVKVYLPETDERQFIQWLNTYCRQRSASDTAYQFSAGWSYKLHYPTLGAQTSVTFTARVYRAFLQESRETTETMVNNVEAIKLEWHRVGDRLKVTISHHDGDWVRPPLNDLLTNIRTNWPEAMSTQSTWAEGPISDSPS